MAEVVQAGEFATEGERQAAAKLRELPDGWLILCNKLLVTNDGRNYEIDFIVVGERWIFVIDEKSWWGKVTGNDQRWFRDDGYIERSPLSKADVITKPLAGHLRNYSPNLRDLKGIWGRGGVLLSRLAKVPEIQDPRAADGVFLLDSVCERLLEIDRRGGNPHLAELRGEIRSCLLGLPESPTVPKQLGLYTITEERAGRAGARVFGATLDREPRQLTVYDLGKDPIDAQQLREFYMREFRVLQRLGGTGLVPEVGDPFPWSDDALVVPVKPAQGRSLALLPPPETHEDFVQELAVAAASFDALQRFHAEKIVHRALRPEAVVVRQVGQRQTIVLTEMFAARMDDQSTIVASLDALALEDPYAAPELMAGYGAATPASDGWSMALIFLERLARIGVVELRDEAGAISIPDLVSRWPTVPSDVLTALGGLFAGLLQVEAQKRRSVVEVTTTLGELLRQLRVETQAAEKGRLDNRYTVQRVLGQGAMARTYLVTDELANGLFAVKTFLRPSIVYEQARAEFTALRTLQHRHLPRIYDVYEADKDVHVKMEYVPGPTLEEVTREFPWPLDRWWTFAQGLLAAVEELERYQLLHRDIKPANIILHEHDGRPVLIDFGLAAPQGEVAHPAGTLRYLPPEAMFAPQPPPTMDRYAAAVVLFQALTGQSPFGAMAGTGGRVARVPDTTADEVVRRLADVLVRALSNDPMSRPTTVAQLRNELRAAMIAGEETDETEALDERHNPWVDQVRGLYRNSGVGNADNRGLDSQFVRDTYVSTALDLRLLPAILERRPRAVFLSGNPGDGKTAFLEQVRVALEEQEGTAVGGDASGWEWQLGDQLFRTCYDASEANNGQSADEQLEEKLRGLEGNTEPAIGLTVLVAINDGRLADFFARYRERFGWLAAEVERARQRTAGDEAAVWVIDLKRRSFVALPTVAEQSVAERVLAPLVQPTEWEICQGCAAKQVCPMRANAVALRRGEVRKRLEYLLLIGHLRRQRHTTMRDLRSAFAYLITANTSCEEVHAARHGESGAGLQEGATLIDRAYWRSAFAPIEGEDDLLADLGTLDPARFPQPRLDRFLHFHRAAGDAGSRGALFAGNVDLSPHYFASEEDWSAATKRRYYFESAIGRAGGEVPRLPWRGLLPYRYANGFFDLLEGRGEEREALEEVANGLLRSDGYAGPARPGWLSVKVDASEAQQLVVLKQFPLDEFRLCAERPVGEGWVEAIADTLTLEHRDGTPRLPITLDLYELLRRFAEGMQPDAPEYRPLLEDLVPFKSALLRRQTTDLILVEWQRREHLVTQEAGKIVRRPVVEREEAGA